MERINLIWSLRGFLTSHKGGASFFQKYGSIKSKGLNLSKYLEFQMGLDHTQEFEPFSCLLSGVGVREEWHFKYITGNVLCFFFFYIIRLARLIPLLFLSIRNFFMCCLSLKSNEYFLVVGSIKHWKSLCWLDGFAL